MKDSRGHFCGERHGMFLIRKIKNPLSHFSPMDLFSLMKTSWKFIRERKATTSKMVQGSFPSCGVVPCCRGWSDCWDRIQAFLKSRQGSFYESMCIHPRLGGRETFFVYNYLRVQNISAWMRTNLSETLQITCTGRSVTALISGAYGIIES